MTVDRIGSAANTQLMLAQLRNVENALNKSNSQVASGKVADTYSGYRSKVASLEAARSNSARAEADAQTATEALTQLDLQDTQLTQLSDLANNVRDVISKALSGGDASSLMTDMENYFGQAVQILNSQNGQTYLYGGENSGSPPVTITTLSALAAAPSASAAFANGSVARTVRIGDGQTVQVGMLASDVASDLFTMFRDFAVFDGGASGPFTAPVTAAQQSFLENAVSQASSAATSINTQAAANGTRYGVVQDAVDRLNASSTVYKSFLSNIEDADMGEAVAKLNQNQVALQASLQMVASLNKLSLLDYL